MVGYREEVGLMKDHAELIALRLRDKWIETRNARDRAIASAMETKSSMPANYWRDEWLARQKLFVASTLVEILEEQD